MIHLIEPKPSLVLKLPHNNPRSHADRFRKSRDAELVLRQLHQVTLTIHWDQQICGEAISLDFVKLRYATFNFN